MIAITENELDEQTEFSEKLIELYQEYLRDCMLHSLEVQSLTMWLEERSQGGQNS